MNTQLVFETILPPDTRPAPIILLLSLSIRVREKFPELRISSHWLIVWARDTIRSLCGYSRAALAIDDPLERLHADLAQCLANDPPAKRRAILAAVAQVHANTEKLSAALDPHCPETLRHD